MGAGESIVGNLGAYQVMTTEAARAGGPDLWQRGVEKAAASRALRNWGTGIAIVSLGANWLRTRRTRPTSAAQAQESVARLGPNLTALARSDDELDCLEVFAQIIESGSELPMFLGVIVAPGGARILTIGNPNPGLTLQVDADLDFDLTHLWFGERDTDAGT
jgi:hypothetical protein